MPYINEVTRDRILNAGGLEGSCEIDTAGELNFAFSYIINSYMRELNYQRINDVIGALEGAKLEFYRRIAVPYEDSKIKINGDVYV